MSRHPEHGRIKAYEWTPGKWWVVKVTGPDGSYTPLAGPMNETDATAQAALLVSDGFIGLLGKVLMNITLKNDSADAVVAVRQLAHLARAAGVGR